MRRHRLFVELRGFAICSRNEKGFGSRSLKQNGKLAELGDVPPHLRRDTSAKIGGM